MYIDKNNKIFGKKPGVISMGRNFFLPNTWLFLFESSRKTILYYFKIFSSENYVGFVNKKVISSSKAFKYLRYKKVIFDENMKIMFSNMKILQKVRGENFLKKIPWWFSKTIIDPILVMNMLRSIIANWCFQKVIYSRLDSTPSDTPQYKQNRLNISI